MKIVPCMFYLNSKSGSINQEEKCRLLINEFRACIARLNKIVRATKAKPIFKVRPEDEDLLERSEDGESC